MSELLQLVIVVAFGGLCFGCGPEAADWHWILCVALVTARGR
jgi:hypothetical protein